MATTDLDTALRGSSESARSSRCQTPSYAQPPRNSPNGWPLRLPPAWVRRKRTNWPNISVPPASLTELESTRIRAVCAQWLATVIQPSLAREEIASAAPAGVTMLSMDDASPPPCLKEIYDPPLITRVRGNPEVLPKPGIAMVGDAASDACGAGVAERRACDLAAQGLVIIINISIRDEWVGRWCRHRQPSWRHLRQRQDGRGFWHGRRPDLWPRKFAALGADSGSWQRSDL